MKCFITYQNLFQDHRNSTFHQHDFRQSTLLKEGQFFTGVLLRLVPDDLRYTTLMNDYF